MDTSEIYIKMCEKTGEIQDSWIPEQGDTVLSYKDYKVLDFDVQFIVFAPESGKLGFPSVDVGYEYNSDGYEFPGNWRNYIFLPRHDQLQEMLGDYNHNLDFIINFGNTATHYWYEPDIEYYMGWGIDQQRRGWNLISMEQLWLAFVMKEKYNKVWDGEEWISAP